MRIMAKTKTAPERLKAWRLSLGLSQEKAAAEVGCTLRWYQQIENDQKSPSLSMSVYMESITGIAPADWVSSPGGTEGWAR